MKGLSNAYQGPVQSIVVSALLAVVHWPSMICTRRSPQWLINVMDVAVFLWWLCLGWLHGWAIHSVICASSAWSAVLFAAIVVFQVGSACEAFFNRDRYRTLGVALYLVVEFVLVIGACLYGLFQLVF